MEWRSINFKGMIELDHSIVGELQTYLVERESLLAVQFFSFLPYIPSLPGSPALPLGETALRFSDTVEIFNKKLKLISSEQAVEFPPEQVVKNVNKSLWGYTEVLEGCSVELFQQINQVPVNQWHPSIAEVVFSVKEILLHRVEELLWNIQRLQGSLKGYSKAFSRKNKWSFNELQFWKNPIDSLLISNLEQMNKMLRDEYEAFFSRYQDYAALSMEVDVDLLRIKQYPILSLLDQGNQKLYVELFHLLKCLEINQKGRVKTNKEIIRSIKHLGGVERFISIFSRYYKELKESLFSSSLEFKSLPHEEGTVSPETQLLIDRVHDFQFELQELLEVISWYRLFLLDNDPNPYVRSRWGFTEWVVGPERNSTKKLLDLIYSVKDLERLFQKFSSGLHHPLILSKERKEKKSEKIDDLLHAMGQPLISRTMMQNHAEKLMEEVEILDELGSPELQVIHDVQRILARAMRNDWKYHVLHGLKSFHHCYQLHKGLIESFDEASHSYRMEQLWPLFNQIRGWVANETLSAHFHEVESDIHDIKSYLQDFLASVQRVVQEAPKTLLLSDTIRKAELQLFDYRYFFGQFLFDIVEKSKGEQFLRNQFLFVDHYFESVEGLLNELKEVNRIS